MSTDTMPGTTARGARLADLGLLVLAAALTVATVLAILDPDLRFGVQAPQLDVLINEAATIIAGGAAALAWLRYRHMADAAALYQAAAFMLFALLAFVQLLGSLGIASSALLLDLDNPGQAPLYAWTFIRLLAALLLARAAMLTLYPRPARGALPVVVAPLVVALVGSLLIYAAEPNLPPALASEALVGLRSPIDVPGILPGVAALQVALQVVGVVLFGVASLYYVRAARRAVAPAGMYLAAGLIFAAFSQVHFALFPGAYAGIVSSSDVMRIAFYAFVVLGIQAEAGATLVGLRSANRQLDDLRQQEVARASILERARLAREVHDGLAQDMWVAKLTAERLGSAPDMAAVRAIQAELEAVIESGIAEAREAVVALREAGREDTPLTEMLERSGRRFADQSGIDVNLALGQLESGLIAPAASGELFRIAQEALANVRKHADATSVRIELGVEGAAVRLSVTDNGVGFDPHVEAAGYGLHSMRERAEIAGGRLTVSSSQSSGTTISVEVPLLKGGHA